ncbi:MAG: acetyl-CoA carboxylase biotin carboxyl carrier protein [Verrucomicrobiales bacterium]|nr:acetyl-CoA carboxylase biotin carboxyl carrier protein [Verrucomicrobiales bacterium]
MDLKDIEKIMKLMDSHGLSQFKLEQDETKLELKKGGDIDIEAVQRMIASSAPPQMMASHAPAAAAPAAPAVAPGGLPPGTEEITSPMVGTFYTARNPESPDFVKVGDKVSPDTVVCIIEAMKVFNDITAEIKGEIVELLVENGTPVQYGEALFRVKTS